MLSKQNEVNHLIFQPEFPVYLYPIYLSSWGGRSWVGDHIFKGMGMGFNKKPWVSAIGHFRVLPGLCIKTRLGAQLFLWKWVLFAWEWKIISISKVEHLTSFWYRGPGELGIGLLPRSPPSTMHKKLSRRHKVDVFQSQTWNSCARSWQFALPFTAWVRNRRWRVMLLIGWSKFPAQARPIRSTTQIWIVTRHQYGISSLVPFAKCRL